MKKERSSGPSFRTYSNCFSYKMRLMFLHNRNYAFFFESFGSILKLSAVRKVLETLLFLALGSFETLGSKLSHGTSSKFADVRTHLRKVSKLSLSSIRRKVSLTFSFKQTLEILSTKVGLADFF